MSFGRGFLLMPASDWWRSGRSRRRHSGSGEATGAPCSRLRVLSGCGRRTIAPQAGDGSDPAGERRRRARVVSPAMRSTDLCREAPHRTPADAAFHSPKANPETEGTSDSLFGSFSPGKPTVLKRQAFAPSVFDGHERGRADGQPDRRVVGMPVPDEAAMSRWTHANAEPGNPTIPDGEFRLVRLQSRDAGVGQAHPSLSVHVLAPERIGARESTAARTDMSERCAYFRVVAAFSWPSRRPTVRTVSPLIFQTRFRPHLQPEALQPHPWRASTFHRRAERGRRSRTSRAASQSQTVRGPVLRHGGTGVPRDSPTTSASGGRTSSRTAASPSRRLMHMAPVRSTCCR